MELSWCQTFVRYFQIFRDVSDSGDFNIRVGFFIFGEEFTWTNNTRRRVLLMARYFLVACFILIIDGFIFI